MIGKYLADIGKAFGCASIPFFATLAGLQPPWPPAIGQVSSGFVLIAALVAWEWSHKRPAKSRRRWIKWGIFLVSVGLLAYLYLYSQYVDPMPGSSARAIRGYECTANARIVYRDLCPDLPSDALERAGWDSTELWTRESVTNIRLLLTTTWLIFTFGLVAAVAGVIAGRKV